MMNETNKVKKKRKVNRIVTIVLLATVLIFFSLIFYINLIPIYYTLIALVFFLAIIFGITILNFKKKRVYRIIGYTLSIILISILIFILVYLFNTLGFLFNMTDGDYSIHNYNVIVLNTSEYNDIKDLKNKNVGISETSKNEELDKAKKDINKKVKLNYKDYEDLDQLVTGLINENVEAIILEDSEIELIKEQNGEYEKIFRIIYEIEIKKTFEDLKDAININKESFNIYISGIDTYGNINSLSRSDVNMVLTVNPKEEKILITWIPRDYYVSINNSSYKDKITHAGIYGIDSSIYAIEKLLNININYYVKVNFTSFVEIIDLLGGINIYNDNTFTALNGQTFKGGNITLNGNDALTFVRERKNLSEGDVGRGKNQIKVLEAIIEKAMSPSIIKKYNSLLKSLDGAFLTNMNQSTMFGFIRREIIKKRDWQIESNTLQGMDSYEYTYSYKNTELYVMKPDMESVNKAIDKIKLIMN